MELPGAAGLLFAALVVIAAFAVRGTTGFGGQALAVPLLALVLPLPVVVASVVVLAALSSFGHWRRDWGRIEWRELARLLPYTLAGVLAGLYVLAALDMRTLTRAFGIFVMLYAVFALATASRPLRIPPHWRGVARGILSTLAGAVGAAFGAAAGPLYAIHFSALQMEKDAFRVTITTILTVQALARIIGYAQLGFYNGRVLALIAAGVPLIVVGQRIGDWLAGRLDQRAFNRGVAVLLLVSGGALILK